MGEYLVVTVACQYASGGERVAVRLAEVLGVPCHSVCCGEGALWIRATGQEMGERLYTLATGTENGVCDAPSPPLPAGEQRFFEACEAVRHLADEGPCVILSDLGEFALREKRDRISFYLCSDPASRIRTLARERGLAASAAVKELSKADRRQRDAYAFHTGERWAVLERYALCLSTSLLGEERAAALMKEIVRGDG